MKVLALLTKISFTPNLIHTTMTQFENIHHLNSLMLSQVFVFTNQNFKWVYNVSPLLIINTFTQVEYYEVIFLSRMNYSC